jgi:hypothetical protein
MVCGLAAAVKAMAPTEDWSWLSRRATRMKLKAKASREKRHAVRHTIDLYRFGLTVMDTAGTAAGPVAAAQRYQAGLIIALLAARPLRKRNFQAITIGESLRWDGRRYWLTFGTHETKMRMRIDEPLPDDLQPYLEAFLLSWRPVLLRKTQKFGGTPIHSPSGWTSTASRWARAPFADDQALHPQGLRHGGLAPSVPRLPADFGGGGSAGSHADQCRAARTHQHPHGREALQPGPHDRRQPPLRGGHLRASPGHAVGTGRWIWRERGYRDMPPQASAQLQ